MNLNPEWILNPLTTYAITGTGLLALLFLWFGAKIDARKCRQQMTAMKECTESALRDLTAKVSEIAVRPAPVSVEAKLQQQPDLFSLLA